MVALVSLMTLCGAPDDGGFAAAAKVLSNHCLRCHNADKQRGGLDLSTRASAVSGGATRDAIVPGEPEKSLLYERARDHSMPPPKDGRPLTAAEVAALAHWITEGVPWPEQATLSPAANAVVPWPTAVPASARYRRRLFWRAPRR